MPWQVILFLLGLLMLFGGAWTIYFCVKLSRWAKRNLVEEPFRTSFYIHIDIDLKFVLAFSVGEVVAGLAAWVALFIPGFLK